MSSRSVTERQLTLKGNLDNAFTLECSSVGLNSISYKYADNNRAHLVALLLPVMEFLSLGQIRLEGVCDQSLKQICAHTNIGGFF